MKKILHITAGLHRNGTETFIMNLFRNINRKEFMFDFLVFQPDDNGYEQEARELGANIYYYHPRNGGIRKYIKSLREFFQTHGHEYSGVHFSGNSFTDIYPIKLAKKHGIPVRVVHSHNSSTSGLHNKLLHRLNRRNLHKVATDFLACSESAREWGYAGTKCHKKSLTVPNGIDMERFAFSRDDREKLRKELGINGESFVVCHTGTFRPVKNHSFLIEIFKEIKKRREDAVLLLCGAGGDEEQVKNQVKELGLEKSVKFLGIRKDVERILSGADAYVFPSLYEGLPFALIEAQASGIPVFASDTISQEIKLTDNLFFLPLDAGAAEWSEKILAYNYENRESGKSDALSKYDIKTTCEILEKIYAG